MDLLNNTNCAYKKIKFNSKTETHKRIACDNRGREEGVSNRETYQKYLNETMFPPRVSVKVFTTESINLTKAQL